MEVLTTSSRAYLVVFQLSSLDIAMRPHNMEPMRCVLALLLLAGCASTSSVKDRPLDEGQWHEFPVAESRITTAARDSIKELGLNVVEDRRQDGATIIVAETGMSAMSWGEVVRVVVQPKGDKTSVRVISERKLTTNITARDYAADVLSKVAAKVGM